MRATLQEYADDVVAKEFRQPLKTAQEACDAVGWAFEDRPKCCGLEAEHRSFLGSSYHCECSKCGRFIHDMSGPSFREDGGVCYLLDGEEVDLDTEHRWIAGQRAKSYEPSPAKQP